jgi:hypothetical protein
MKKNLIIAFFLFSLHGYAQQINFNDLQTADKKTRGKYESYTAKDGSLYQIGDRLTIGVPSSNKTFAFITEGDGILLPITALTAANSGQETEIKKIWVVGNNRAGFSVYFRTKGLIGISNYSINVENAIATGEVNSFGMNSDEALAELKKAKDKLDLELITQDEYEAIKADLVKYIN